LPRQDPHARIVRSTTMSKIKDVVTKLKDMKNLDGKVTEVDSSIHEVFIVMKML
jgi:hypothetical protein